MLLMSSLYIHPSRLFLKSDFFHDGRTCRSRAVMRVEKYPKINLKIKTTQLAQKGNQKKKKRKWDILGH